MSIGLMDCNNFFVSCERLFRPDLAKRPVAVLSSNDGCVVSRSQEVKDMGIPMGIPYFEVRDLCQKQEITLFSSNFTLYRDISNRVMRTLSEEFESCEIYSIDESFFTVPDTITEAEITNVRDRIIQKTGIPVSFGLGATKTIAKAASERAKKGTGVFILTEERWEKAVADISCGSIWGIGRQTSQKLREHNIETVADFLTCGRAAARTLLGVSGERLFFELSGISATHERALSAHNHQSIASTRSFAHETHDCSVLESAIGYHVSHLSERLRKNNCVASRITVLASGGRYGDYALRERTATAELLSPTNNTGDMLRVALGLLKKLYDSEIPYKKAGAVLHGIFPAAALSGNLFGNQESGTTAHVYRTIDAINMKFGTNTVHSGIIFDTEKWRESRKLKSPEYTTRWSEIPCVKAR